MRIPRTAIVLVVGSAVGCEQLLGVHDIKGSGTTDGATDGSSGGGGGGLCVPAPQFSASTQYAIPTSAFETASLALGDVNNDGVIDAAIALQNDVVVLNGDGNGGFHPYHSLGGSAIPASLVAIADADHDGLNDVIICAGNSLTTYLQDPANVGHFKPPVNSAVVCQPAGGVGGLSIATFNDDLFPDLYVTPGGSAYSTVMLGDGTGAFTTDIRVMYPTQSDTVVADIDGDHFDDILLQGSQLRYNQGGSAGGFDAPVTIGGTTNGVIGVGHYSGSGQGLDIVAHADAMAGNLFTHTAPRAFEQKSSVFAGPLLPSNEFPPQSVHGIDLNGDGLDDIVALGEGSSQSQGVLQCSPGVFDPAPGSAAPLRFGSPTGALARKFVDIDGNGKPDLIEVSFDGQFLVVWRQ